MSESVVVQNIFSLPTTERDAEAVTKILGTTDLLLERVVSTGQSTPDQTWYDQGRAEWVVLLKGSAGVRFEAEDTTHALAPGDALLIPAHVRHRVEWTDPDHPTVWLALHYDDTGLSPNPSEL